MSLMWASESYSEKNHNFLCFAILHYVFQTGTDVSEVLYHINFSTVHTYIFTSFFKLSFSLNTFLSHFIWCSINKHYLYNNDRYLSIYLSIYLSVCNIYRSKSIRYIQSIQSDKCNQYIQIYTINTWNPTWFERATWK